MKNNVRRFLIFFCVLVSTFFIVYVTNYATESSKLIYLFNTIEVHAEAQYNGKSYRGSDYKFNEKSTKLPETALPTRNLKSLIGCVDKDSSGQIVQHGAYWLLKNFVLSSKPVKCHESVTYTTHCDFMFLSNVAPLVERWHSPISVAIWAPGDDIDMTLASILFLRNCHAKSFLIQQFATFHIFFEAQFLPKNIPRNFGAIERDYTCPAREPFVNFPYKKTFKAVNNLTYPVNVGRNLARGAALTHFLLASDIELFPSYGLVDDFFAMIQRDPDKLLTGKNVFVLPIFEVGDDEQVPGNKSELVDIFNQGFAIWFHHKICPTCHQIPKANEWIGENAQDESEMKVFTSRKRKGQFDHWEPIFIGTNDDPFYDERLSWEGKSDKMTQAYIMCLLDYDFNVLSNAFLVHKPGIKSVLQAARENLEKINKDLISDRISLEIKAFYGERQGCKI